MNVDELVVKHAGWIRRTAGRFYSNVSDADDLAGETIYKILSQGVRFNTKCSFKPWALTIMVNTYKTQYNRRRCVLFTGYEKNAIYPSYESSEQRAAVGRILSIIREYGRKSRNIESVLLYAKGFSYEEIADIIGIPAGTVKSRVSAGRRLLREALD